MKDAQQTFFAPSDLALPYTAEERANVPVPRDKLELEHELDQAGIPFKKTLGDFILGDALDDPKYISYDDEVRHFLEGYFQ